MKASLLTLPAKPLPFNAAQWTARKMKLVNPGTIVEEKSPTIEPRGQAMKRRDATKTAVF
jgi:hypothetical protein